MPRYASLPLKYYGRRDVVESLADISLIIV